MVHDYLGAGKIVHIQSVLPQEDMLALKKKTGESSNKEAISKAIYHYLMCEDVTEEPNKTKRERY